MANNRRFFILIYTIWIVAILAGCGGKGQGDSTVKGRMAAGSRYIAQNKFEEAIKEFRAAVTIAPEDFEARYELGLAYYKAKDFKNAEESLRAAININPKDAKTYNMLGVVLEKDGLFEEAKKAFQQALQANKKCDEAKANLANIEEAKREYAFYRFASDFIHILSKEYSNGNNSFMRGAAGTKEIREENGRITRYDVNYEIYLAKEYFDKCSKIIEEAADRTTSKALLDVIDILAAAIQQRQEAIDLQLEGYATDRSYSGEFEKAKAKAKIADTYYVDAATRIEATMQEKKGLFSDKDFADIKYLISYYSQDKTAQIEDIR